MRAIAAMAVIAAIALSACSGSTSSNASGRHPWTIQGTMRWADGEDIDNLNPLLSTETLVNDLSSFTMGYFFMFDDKGRPVPSLCLTVPTKQNHLISPDGKSITFKLRRGVPWHDGKPFTSADVAFTVKTILDPKTNVPTRVGWDDIQRVDTPDPYTAIFRLKQPFAAFMNRYFTPVGNPAILPKHLLEGQDINHAAYNSLPVGLGPFRYVRWSRANEVVMEAFPQWWGGPPKLKRVIFKIIPDANTLKTALETHAIDVFVRVPNQSYEQVAAIPHTRSLSFDTLSYGHLDFNVTNPILADLQVRQALARAVDVRLIWNKIYHRSGFLACTPISHLSWAYDANAQCYAFDLKAAAAQLDGDGWKMRADGLRHKGGRTLHFAFAGNSGNPSLDSTVLLIQSWFKQIGASVEYFRYPTDKLFASYAAGGIVATRHYDITLYAWSLPPDPDLTNLVACSRISPKGQNYMGYCDPQVDAALQDALMNYNQNERKADYIRVQQLLSHDLPFLVITQRTEHMTYNDDFRGIKPGPVMDFWNPQSISN